MTPCGRPHGLDHRIDLARQPRTGLQRGLRAEFQRFGALVRVARGDEHLQTGGMGELDGRSGHAAARALNEHGVARLDAGGIEQQRVGGQPAGAECGRLSRGEVCWLGEHVGGRHGRLLGHRAGVFLGEDRAALARGHARAIGADERVQHHFAAGLEPMLAGDVLVQNAHGIGAQDHRRPLGGQPHAPQRPDVVMVHAHRTHRDGRPERVGLGFGLLAHRQRGKRIGMVDGGCVYGLHCALLGIKGITAFIVPHRAANESPIYGDVGGIDSSCGPRTMPGVSIQLRKD